MIEGIKAREESNDNATAAINARLADIQRQIDGLIPRLEFGEKERADLSTLHNSLAEPLKALTISSDQIAHRIADLEQRLSVNGRRVRGAPQFNSCSRAARCNSRHSRYRGKTHTGRGRKTNSNGTDNSGDDGASRPHHSPDAQRSAERETQTDDYRPPVAPENRGGGSRTERETMGQVGSPLEMASLPKPELIATRGSGDWQIFVEVDATDLSKLDVVQGTTSLPRGSNAFQFGPLRDLTTPLQIQFDGATVIERTFGHGSRSHFVLPLPQ